MTARALETRGRRTRRRRAQVLRAGFSLIDPRRTQRIEPACEADGPIVSARVPSSGGWAGLADTAAKVIKLGMRGFFSLLVAALSLGLSLAAAPPELPSTPAGQVLAGYLEALNSGNKAKLEAFIKAHRPDR